MDGHRALLAGGDGLDGKAGAGVHVAAHEHVGLGGLVGKGVRRGAPPPASSTLLPSSKLPQRMLWPMLRMTCSQATVMVSASL